jgi:hypothetical protein
LGPKGHGLFAGFNVIPKNYTLKKKENLLSNGRKWLNTGDDWIIPEDKFSLQSDSGAIKEHLNRRLGA